MALKLTKNNDKDKEHHATLQVTGAIDTSIYKEIESIAGHVAKNYRGLTVDLTHLDNINSLGLGSLMKLRHHVAPVKPDLIVRENSLVDSVLDLAQFEALFRIDKR